jgi:hypothetical protein
MELDLTQIAVNHMEVDPPCMLKLKSIHNQNVVVSILKSPKKSKNRQRNPKTYKPVLKRHKKLGFKP